LKNEKKFNTFRGLSRKIKITDLLTYLISSLAERLRDFIQIIELQKTAEREGSSANWVQDTHGKI